MRLEMEEVVGAQVGENGVEALRVRLQKEELLPEALGFLDFIVVLVDGLVFLQSLRVMVLALNSDS